MRVRQHAHRVVRLCEEAPSGRREDDVDRAVMALAERVVDDATSIGDADVEPLRDLGLTDAEIMDVILAAAARCFFSKTLDALQLQPDAHYNELDADVRDALVVGRPIEAA